MFFQGYHAAKSFSTWCHALSSRSHTSRRRLCASRIKRNNTCPIKLKLWFQLAVHECVVHVHGDDAKLLAEVADAWVQLDIRNQASAKQSLVFYCAATAAQFCRLLRRRLQDAAIESHIFRTHCFRDTMGEFWRPMRAALEVLFDPMAHATRNCGSRIPVSLLQIRLRVQIPVVHVPLCIPSTLQRETRFIT